MVRPPLTTIGRHSGKKADIQALMAGNRQL
jgi:hypothetical protein